MTFVITNLNAAGVPVEAARVECLPKLTYDLSELTEPYETRAAYPTITATDPYGNVVSITTNRAGEGRFKRIETPFGPEYRQTAGTLRALPGSDAAVKRMLCEIYRDTYVWDADDWDNRPTERY